MNKALFLSSTAALTLLCGCHCGKIAVLAQPGRETPGYKPFEVAVFQPCSQIVRAYGKYHIVKAPKTPQKELVFAFADQKLEPNGLYEFRCKFVGQEQLAIMAFSSDIAGNKVLGNRNLMKTVSFANIDGMEEYVKEFPVDPKAEKTVPSMYLVRNDTMRGNLLMIEEMSIRRIGKMKTASADLKKINFAAEHDFSRAPLGDYAGLKRGMGKNAKHWPNVTGEIVKENGESVLHIVRKPKDYPYPYLNLPDFPVDPHYHWMQVTMKIKGKGKFSLGLWWHRREAGWEHGTIKVCELTDQWQTVTAMRPCMNGDVQHAAIGFVAYDSGEYFIKEIDVRLL